MDAAPESTPADAPADVAGPAPETVADPATTEPAAEPVFEPITGPSAPAGTGGTQAPRALPLNAVLRVNGVSFRQDVVHTLVEHDEVRICHDTLNPHDAYACRVETLTGDHLGFVPRDLAYRLAGNHRGGIWRARITEILRGQTWGVRVALGPLVTDGHEPQAGANVPGLRHRGDGVIEDDRSITVGPAADPRPGRAADGSPAAAEHAQAPHPEPPLVSTRTGRVLGRFVSQNQDRVVVRAAAGTTASYPAAVVVIGIQVA